MTIIARKSQIVDALRDIDLISVMERAFRIYSAGEAVVPPVAELLFDSPPGDVHIKYGYVRGESYYVVKVASGFYQNPGLGLPASNGLMLLFVQKTGELKAILLDEGALTDERTAAAGAVAAKHLAPSRVDCIGIVGTGIQAELQLRHLAAVCSCRDVMVWGRQVEKASAFCERVADSPFSVTVAPSIEALVEAARLIVTTTPAQSPLLHTVRPGTHLTAVGADTPGKQELDVRILARADIVVSDSLAQSRTRGEVFRSVQAGELEIDRVLELGSVISGDAPGRTGEQQVSVVDLTGVATQDIAIATAVAERLSLQESG